MKFDSHSRKGVDGPNDSLIIWDLEGVPNYKDHCVVLWKNVAEKKNKGIISVPELIEENAAHFREMYVNWLYRVASGEFRSISLIEHLKLRKNLSYWWLTLLNEKCNYSKSRHIEDAICYLAFVHWACHRPVKNISLATNNHDLALCIRRWCLKHSVEFEIMNKTCLFFLVAHARRFFFAVVQPIAAMRWLFKYLLGYWCVRGSGIAAWRGSQAQITLVSYLPKITEFSQKNGKFYSQYWGNLPKTLRSDKVKTNWLHLNDLENSKPLHSIPAEMVRAFNESGEGNETHATLETFLCVSVVFKALLDWFKLIWRAVLCNKEWNFQLANQDELWLLFTRDWWRSMIGSAALNNTLNHRLFETAMRSLPNQRLCCYLRENQSWEASLIQTYRAQHKGSLIGFAHSTIRFWDLRYYTDSKIFLSKKDKLNSLPDKVAVNGDAGLEALTQSGYPKDNVVEVETLRYNQNSVGQRSGKASRPISRKSLLLLVLGEYERDNTRFHLKLLNEASNRLPFSIECIVKPHPNCPVEPKEYPNLKIELTGEDIEGLVKRTDVTYVSEVTSAGIDAYLNGAKVVSSLKAHALNMSPLLNFEGVFFVRTSEQLTSTLEVLYSSKNTLQKKTNYYNIDRALPRWKKLLYNIT